MNTFSRALALMTISLMAANSPSWAGNFGRWHPRRAQVLRRDARLDRTLNNDYGKLGGHYWQLQGEDNRIRQQEQRDARMNGGYLTRGQQAQLDREENRLHQQITNDYGRAPGDAFGDKHPRRAQVLSGDAGLNRQISQDYGKLDGNYGKLMNEDSSIRRQEQRDARINGGYLTPGQQQHLDAEESQLQSQINNDLNK